MKKIILLFAVGFLAITANAQKIAESVVSPGVKGAFVKLYPTAVVTTWTQEPVNNVRAEFINAGVPTTVLMGPNNNLLQTTVEIKTSELPKDAADYCADKNITKSYRVTTYTGIVLYKAVGNKEYLFDTNGKIAVR